jgi:hypothetical protein
MELKLEIEEGSKYNNLINEIEDEFKNTYKKANLCKVYKEYEKMIIYFDRCLKIDPDNFRSKYVKEELKYYFNKYIRTCYDNSKKNYSKKNYEISLYFLTKGYCMLLQYNELLNDSNKEIYNEIKELKININKCYIYNSITDLDEKFKYEIIL